MMPNNRFKIDFIQDLSCDVIYVVIFDLASMETSNQGVKRGNMRSITQKLAKIYNVLFVERITTELVIDQMGISNNDLRL